MKFNLKKFILLLSCVIINFTGCSPEETTTDYHEPEETFPVSVDFLKVGKADSAVIKTQNQIIVIDCGEKSDGKKLCSCLHALGAEKIDVLIFTHYDQDHIGGAVKVLEEFPVQRVLAPEYSENSKEYQKLCEAMQAENLSFDLVNTAPEKFFSDDAYIEIFPCQRENYAQGNDNNHSLVIRVTHHEEIFLFAGDAMQERLAEIMTIGDCTVLKEPYHGREIANLPEFLAAVRPEYAIVSTNQENYSPVVQQALSEKNIQTYVTFQDGNIRCTSSGKEMTVETGIEY